MHKTFSLAVGTWHLAAVVTCEPQPAGSIQFWIGLTSPVLDWASSEESILPISEHQLTSLSYTETKTQQKNSLLVSLIKSLEYECLIHSQHRKF